MVDTAYPTEYPSIGVDLALLKPHPRNYRSHPKEQLDQLVSSLREHGQYRNIVLANDNTILAGHGVALAAGALGWETVQAIKLDIEPLSSAAIKIVVADNELAHMAEVNDRALTELLKEIRDTDTLGLLGWAKMT
jgi:ParB-like chromosome segregation protein Spo0J